MSKQKRDQLGQICWALKQLGPAGAQKIQSSICANQCLNDWGFDYQFRLGACGVTSKELERDLNSLYLQQLVRVGRRNGREVYEVAGEALTSDEQISTFELVDSDCDLTVLGVVALLNSEKRREGGALHCWDVKNLYPWMDDLEIERAISFVEGRKEVGSKKRSRSRSRRRDERRMRDMFELEF